MVVLMQFASRPGHLRFGMDYLVGSFITIKNSLLIYFLTTLWQNASQQALHELRTLQYGTKKHNYYTSTGDQYQLSAEVHHNLVSRDPPITKKLH